MAAWHDTSMRSVAGVAGVAGMAHRLSPNGAGGPWASSRPDCGQQMRAAVAESVPRERVKGRRRAAGACDSGATSGGDGWVETRSRWRAHLCTQYPHSITPRWWQVGGTQGQATGARGITDIGRRRRAAGSGMTDVTSVGVR